MRKYATIYSSLQPHPAQGLTHLPSFSETFAHAVMPDSVSGIRSIQGLKLIENGIDISMKEVMRTIDRLKAEESTELKIAKH